MSDEIQDFVSALKKTRDYSAFANAPTSSPKNKTTDKTANTEIPITPVSPVIPVIPVSPTVSELSSLNEKSGEKLGNSKALSYFIERVNHAHEQDLYKVSKNKRCNVDVNIHSLLMHLKHRGGVKSMSTFINAVLSNFLETHREELKHILSETPHHF